MARSILLMFLVVFSASAGAQGLSYNYFEVSYGRVDVDGTSGSSDGDGFGVGGSMAINENFHVTGSYQGSDLDNGIDTKLLEIDFGYNTTLSQNLDLIAHVGYLKLDFDPGGAGLPDDDALLIGGGVRAALAPNVELNGVLDYVNFDRQGGEMRANAGFLVGLTEEFAVGLATSFWDDVNIYRISVRLNFE